MGNPATKALYTEDASATTKPTRLRVQQYELLFELTAQLLVTQSLDERLSLALDTITENLGYQQVAIALIDSRGKSLHIRQAIGFDDSVAIERIEMPLDSAEPWVDVMHSGRPTWILANGDQSAAAFLDRLKCKTDILALPLFGGHASPKTLKGEFPPEPLGEENYWTIKARRLGALYIAINRRAVSQSTLKFLQRVADRIGVTTAAILQHERMAANIGKLQRERQWVESIMKSVADPIVLTNLDNEILLQNQRAEELFSGSEEASEGKRRALKMNDLLFSAYLSSAAVSSTEIIGRDLTLVDPIEGSDIHFEVISTPAVNTQGDRIGLVSVFRDVTDLRRANEELARNFAKLQQAESEARRERDRLDLIIENVGQPVVVTDASGNFILFNRRAESLFQQEQVSTRPTNLLLQQADASTSRALAAVRANSVKLTSFISGLVTETRTGRQAEIELIAPETGELLQMEITSVEVPDAKGQVTAVVSILHDLSEIRELERRRVEQQLFESEKLAAVGTLAASIAHEVNNPLEAIKNSLFLLKSTDDGATKERFLNIAFKETERVSHIIRQMLGFARRSGGVEWVDVNQLVEETLVLVENKLNHSGIRVEREFDAVLPAVHAHPDQLRQVFLNLILNAQQSIGGVGRGGKIRIKTSRHEMATQSSIAVEISDTGVGINQDDLARIFEPFFSTRRDGTGLGLWVTQNIVRYHGGRIEVKSAMGKGTSFQIILPIDSPALPGERK